MYNKVLPIKTWSEEDRPREKLLIRGKKALTDAELLAVILGSGSRTETAIGLAQRILHDFDQNLQELSKCSPKDLMRFNGVGEAKAIAITATFELGRRRQLTDVKNRQKIQGSKDVYDVMGPLLADLPHEEFWVLFLNRSNKILGKERISKGGVAGTVVDAKMIFRPALLCLASSIILCHNHPSGNLRPSQADIDITRKLKQAGESMDISVLDHIIISDQGYYSFADEGSL